MDASLASSVTRALGTTVRSARSVAGGDINDAWALELADGRDVFVKSNARADRTMFAREAEGLAWLAEADALRVPEVVGVSSGEDGGAPWLALELVPHGRPARDHDERLGRGLALMHRFGAPSFGLEHDNFIGRLPQPNARCATWPELYRTRRLEAQLRRAKDAGLASARMMRGFETLFARLEALVGPPEPPSRLHGDLWGGNAFADASGAPVLVDPAVYGGHREVDLAMMRLFGGFSARVLGAYAEAWPLADGHEDRVALYQLYPLLVHVNLFGASYVGAVERALGELC